MPPTRGRLPQDDARTDIAATREKHTTTTSTVTKVRRNVAAVPMASMSSKDSGAAMNYNSMAGGLSAPGVSITVVVFTSLSESQYRFPGPLSKSLCCMLIARHMELIHHLR